MIDKLPKIIPIFPLENILFLPSATLPLYVFENRYLNMVNDALKEEKIIGMIQLATTKTNSFKEVFKTGCAGKIVFYEKTPDNKILLILSGISRFKIKKELALKDGYRRIVPNWEIYKNFDKQNVLEKEDKEKLLENIKLNVRVLNFNFFQKQFNHISANEIIQIIAREFSFSDIENQSIIESKDIKTRVNLFIKLIQNSILSSKNNSVH